MTVFGFSVIGVLLLFLISFFLLLAELLLISSIYLHLFFFLVFSDFFASLGESTLPEVSFNDFSFAYNAEAPEISMVGEAKGFIPIAQQSDLFEKNQYIQNPIFSDFQLADSNIVSFNLTFTLNSELLYYGRTIKNNQNNSFVEDNEVVIQNQDEDTLPAGKSVEFGNITNN